MTKIEMKLYYVSIQSRVQVVWIVEVSSSNLNSSSHSGSKDVRMSLAESLANWEKQAVVELQGYLDGD